MVRVACSASAGTLCWALTHENMSATIDSMDIETNERLRRVALHHALADPARLAIVDALLVSDLSPGELGGFLDLPSNLLAHHLRVLQDVGLIARSRSHADRRRAYVRLIPATLDALRIARTVTAPRVVFVCTRNAARSRWPPRCGRPAARSRSPPREPIPAPASIRGPSASPAVTG